MTRIETYFDTLESIIKAEPEEFQVISIDDVLRSRANTLLEPVVLLTRLKIMTTYEVENSPKNRSDPTITEKSKILAKKGNERFDTTDPHTCCLCQKVIKGRGNLVKHIQNIHFRKLPISECLASKAKISVDSKECRIKNEFSQNQSLYDLIRNGNDGLGPNDSHVCCLCQKVSKTRRYLKKHLENFHGKSTKLHCDLCPRIFFSRELIFEHMKRAHFEKCLVCNICGFKTANNSNFKNHKRIHSEKVECPICKKYVSSLRVHKKTHDPKEKCPVCKKPVGRTNMKAHVKAHAESRFKCKNCKETFEKSETLRRHNLRSHYNGELFECHCGSVYRLKKNLKRHQETHNESVPCKVCEKKFSSLDSLKLHWRGQHFKTHGMIESSNVKILNISGPFICDKCGSKTLTRTYFHNHNFRCHRNIKLECDLCHLTFKHKSILAKHLRKDHLKLRPFECKICAYRSFTNSDLTKHMLKHGPKTECKVCHKFFANINDHSRSHAKVRCSICSLIVTKKGLSRHIQAHRKTK